MVASNDPECSGENRSGRSKALQLDGIREVLEPKLYIFVGIQDMNTVAACIATRRVLHVLIKVSTAEAEDPVVTSNGNVLLDHVVPIPRDAERGPRTPEPQECTYCALYRSQVRPELFFIEQRLFGEIHDAGGDDTVQGAIMHGSVNLVEAREIHQVFGEIRRRCSNM